MIPETNNEETKAVSREPLPLGGASCSLSSTPDTDGLMMPLPTTRENTIFAFQTLAEHARKMERERNAYRRALTSGECLKCLLNGWDTEERGPCPPYPECSRAFPENS